MKRFSTGFTRFPDLKTINKKQKMTGDTTSNENPFPIINVDLQDIIACSDGRGGRVPAFALTHKRTPVVFGRCARRAGFGTSSVFFTTYCPKMWSAHCASLHIVATLLARSYYRRGRKSRRPQQSHAQCILLSLRTIHHVCVCVNATILCRRTRQNNTARVHSLPCCATRSSRR